MRGGYQIIDFKGNNLSNLVTINGIYESIESNHYKPLLLSGLNIDGIEKPDVFSLPLTKSGNYVFEIYGGSLTVTTGDMASFSDVSNA